VGQALLYQTFHLPSISGLEGQVFGGFKESFGDWGDVFEARQLRDKSRQILIEIFTECKDTPEDWSKDSWGEWWKSHRDTVELPREIVADLAQSQKEFEHQCLLFQEVAKMLERQGEK